jgi:hypothetical protein
LVSTASSQGSCTTNGEVIVFDLGTVANGTTAVATIVVSPSTADVMLTNVAIVVRNEADGDPANNTVTNTVVVAPPVVMAGNASVVEGDIGMTNAAFLLQLSAPSAKTVTVGYVTSNWTASAGSDYLDTNGVVTFAPGITNQAFNVQVKGDISVEPTETFSVNLSATNAVLATNRVTGSILDDDGLPGKAHHFAWSPVSSPQRSGAPFPVVITAQDVSNHVAVSFTDKVALQIATMAGGEITVGTDASPAPFPMDPEFSYMGPAERSQAIYLAGEIGGARRIIALAVKVDSLSEDMGYEQLNNWTIRLKHTSLSCYSTYLWEGSGWTTVYQTNLVVAGTGWRVFPFATPFDYNGTDNLMVDFSFNSSAFASSINCAATPLASVQRTLWALGYGDPLSWSLSPAPMNTEYVPDIRLTCQSLGSNSFVLFPTNTASFSNGIWSGNLMLTGSGSNVVLTAVDAAGHNGTSTPFSLLPPALSFDISRTRLLFTNGGFSLRLTGCSERGSVVIYASTNFVNWLPLCTNLPAAGAVEFIDCEGTNRPLRFYRAGQR